MRIMQMHRKNHMLAQFVLKVILVEYILNTIFVGIIQSVSLVANCVAQGR